MGILDRILGGRVVTRRSVYYINPVGVKGMSAAQLYETQPALRSVISFLADNVAGLPLKCYIREDDNDRPRDTESALAKVIAHPNAWQTRHELIRATVSDYLLNDEAYWLSIPADNEAGWAIVSIPAEWVAPKTRNGLEISEYRITNPIANTEVEVSASDIIRFAGWSPHGSADSSTRIEALKEILQEQISAWNFRNSTWRNGGRVQQWISRPLDAPDWTDNGGRKRFAESWKNRFAGDDGTDTGGTPLLEDGMRLETTQFNAREAQWAEATRLSREDVCAVYHVNPGLIYHTDAQTYASAKDNARALYADTLAPVLDMLQQRINASLVPALGLDSSHYCEFELDAKLRGSFEERAAVLQTSVGAPWMTRNEARALMNMPALEDGDELVTPLNVLVGGQASPTDSAPTAFASLPETKSADPVRFKAEAEDDDAHAIAEILGRFFERQSRSVIPKLEKSAKSDDFPAWWDADRWNRELAADLLPTFKRQAAQAGRRTIDALGLDGEYDEPRTDAYLEAMAAGKARAINNVTQRELQEMLDGDFDEDAMSSTAAGVFERARKDRAEVSGRSFATALSCWGALEACRQRGGDRRIMKTWVVTSGNPRPSHAALDGETVPYSDEFSNGANAPGDEMLTPDETCNCQCRLDVLIP